MQEEYMTSWEWNEVVEVTEKVLWVDSCPCRNLHVD